MTVENGCVVVTVGGKGPYRCRFVADGTGALDEWRVEYVTEEWPPLGDRVPVAVTLVPGLTIHGVGLVAETNTSSQALVGGAGWTISVTVLGSGDLRATP